MLIHYTNIINSINLATYDIETGEILISGLEYDIKNSNMNNKTIDYIRWDKKSELLTLNFINDVSNEDKTKLTFIIENVDYDIL